FTFSLVGIIALSSGYYDDQGTNDPACKDKAGDDRLWNSENGGFLRPGNSQSGWFVSAVKRAMRTDPDSRRVIPHDLRHTAASLAISAGANVKVVQRMLGHKNAAETLNIYAALFPDDLDNVTDALTRQRAQQLWRDSREEPTGRGTGPS
uniref:tyrosine-type recombinase/integrase n=1 Tax=unclassified Microbacterium TaxID=2609290 RepID=UPI001443BB95